MTGAEVPPRDQWRVTLTFDVEVYAPRSHEALTTAMGIVRKPYADRHGVVCTDFHVIRISGGQTTDIRGLQLGMTVRYDGIHTGKAIEIERQNGILEKVTVRFDDGTWATFHNTTDDSVYRLVDLEVIGKVEAP